MLYLRLVLDFLSLGRLPAHRISVGAAVFAVAVGCAISASDDAAGAGGSASECVGPHCDSSFDTDAGADQTTVDVVAPAIQPSREGGLTSNVLCGQGCSPDDRYAQSCMDPDAGLVWTVPDDASLSGVAGAAGGASTDEPAPVDDVPPLGCYVQSTVSGGYRLPVAVCASAGTGTSGAPCVNSAACAPGFGCAGDVGGAGQCRRFCCQGVVSCDEPGTYCAERALHETEPSEGVALTVPVCVVGDHCSLADPYPCPAEQEGACCPEGTACTLVRSDGTTACVVPGEGEAGEPCPCAHGHVCSDSSGLCLRLCQTDGNAEQCELGHCQWNSALPEGFGVCTLEGTR